MLLTEVRQYISTRVSWYLTLNIKCGIVGKEMDVLMDNWKMCKQCFLYPYVRGDDRKAVKEKHSK